MRNPIWLLAGLSPERTRRFTRAFCRDDAEATMLGRTNSHRNVSALRSISPEPVVTSLKMKLRIDPTKRPIQPQSDLQSDSKTLRYELENLVGLALQYSPSWVTSDPIRNNAYVEAFAVHCRTLIFFLYAHLDEITANGILQRFSAVRDTDVLAYDFSRSWDQDCPPPSQVLVDSKWQADKHVAHITTDRREVNQVGSAKQSVWRLTEAVSAICDVMDCFLKKTPPQSFEAAELVRMNRAIDTWRHNTAESELATKLSGKAFSTVPDPELMGIAINMAKEMIEERGLTFAAFVQRVYNKLGHDLTKQAGVYLETAWKVAIELGHTTEPVGNASEILKQSENNDGKDGAKEENDAAGRNPGMGDGTG